MGKPPSGLAGGNLKWLGSYVVCQNISDAQYCLASNLDLEITEKQVNSLFNANKGLHFPLMVFYSDFYFLIVLFNVHWSFD